MGSGRETIEPMGKAHKRTDSGVVVGNGARIRSLVEAWRRENKHAFVMPRIRGGGACSRSVVQRFSCRNAPAVLGLLCSPAGRCDVSLNPLATNGCPPPIPCWSELARDGGSMLHTHLKGKCPNHTLFNSDLDLFKPLIHAFAIKDRRVEGLPVPLHHSVVFGMSRVSHGP